MSTAASHVVAVFAWRGIGSIPVFVVKLLESDRLILKVLVDNECKDCVAPGLQMVLGVKVVVVKGKGRQQFAARYAAMTG